MYEYSACSLQSIYKNKIGKIPGALEKCIWNERRLVLLVFSLFMSVTSLLLLGDRLTCNVNLNWLHHWVGPSANRVVTTTQGTVIAIL